jgi:hypothetical protein
VVASNITQTTATLSWDAVTTAASYEIYKFVHLSLATALLIIAATYNLLKHTHKAVRYNYYQIPVFYHKLLIA